MSKENRNESHLRRYKIVLACVWACVLVFCVVNRKYATVDGVLAWMPRNALWAAVFLLLLFALKSLSVFIFSGILFAASGLLFPLPEAIGLNILGTVVMASVPYWLGRQLGREIIEQIESRYPKMTVLQRIRTKHEFTFSFLARMVSVLPADVVSLYMGASGLHYGRYLAGSVLGMLLPTITFPIMGMNITAPGSPEFLVSLCIQAAASAASLGGCWLCYRKRLKQGE